jgi:hypothetical protein
MKVENLFHIVSNCGDFFVRKQGIYDSIFFFQKILQHGKSSPKKKVINATSRAQSSIASSSTYSCDPHPPTHHPLETSYVYDNA